MTDNSTGDKPDGTRAALIQQTTEADMDNKMKATKKKELTWAENLTVVIPGKLADWAKNIFTQLRP